MLVGIGASRLVGVLAGFKAIVSAGSILLAFGVSFVIGVFFGFYPGQQSRRSRSNRCLALRMKATYGGAHY